MLDFIHPRQLIPYQDVSGCAYAARAVYWRTISTAVLICRATASCLAEDATNTDASNPSIMEKMREGVGETIADHAQLLIL